jgi:hypothetical protein
MRTRLQITLMAGLTAISFLPMVFAPTTARAQSGASSGAGLGAIITTTDETGRKIFVNDDAGNGDGAVSASRAVGSTVGSAGSRSPLVYWSVTEHRFKPVPTNGAVMRAARSAASEVSSYLDRGTQTHTRLNRAFTPQDVDAAIDEAAARHHVDPSLVRSVVKVESNFNPNAVSRKGAMGLMQLMPSTARSLKVSNPFDPAQNVDAGVRHLRKLLDSYGGDVRLSLAAYNAGSGAVARSAGVPRYRETQDYVRRITTLYNGGSESLLGSRMTTSAHQAVHVQPVHVQPVHVQRDARGVLNISNTD